MRLHKAKTIVGLDIEAGSIAATELASDGDGQGVRRTAVANLDPGLFRDGEVVDVEGLAAALAELFAGNQLGKDVCLGLANQRVAVRMLSLPPIEDPKELETAVRFQAQEHVPMPVEQAVLDWVRADDVILEGGERRAAVVVAAARRDMVDRMLETLRKAGLRPAGFDVAAFGMIRALNSVSDAQAEPDAVERAKLAQAAHEAQSGEGGMLTDAQPPPATLYCNLGDTTNLAVARGSICLFTRVSGYGVEGIAQRLAERRELTLEHSRQWLVHVGLSRPVEDVEGEPETVAATREVLEEGAGKLADELRLSLEYYAAQEGAPPVEGIKVGGPGSAVDGLPDRLGGMLGLPVEVGRPPALRLADELSAARLTVSYGLALGS